MGIYSRYATAVLVLFTSSAFSATRVSVKPTSETVITGARTGAISTPAGDVAFYGADKVYSFTAGDSVAPTVREVKSTVGTVSFPYGPEAAYPNGTGISSSTTKIKVKPVAVVPKSKILVALKNGLKANPGQLVLTATVSAAVGAVGWIIDEGSQIKKIDKSPVNYSPGPTDYKWTMSKPHSSTTTPLVHPSASSACAAYSQAFAAGYPNITSSGATIVSVRPGIDADCRHSWSGASSGSSTTTLRLSGSTCPSGLILSTDTTNCYSASPTPVSNSDIDGPTLDSWVSQQTASWLGDLLKEVCKASLSPSNCYSEMEDRSKRTLQGPATVPGPWFTKTSTFPKPDGTTGTKTETTSTKYDFTYGPEHFDVNPERKTTTTEDGAVTSETTETDGTPAEDVSDTPDEETQPEESYTFNDSDLPAVEPFYTQKYPDGFQGVWDSANTDFEQSAFVSFLNSFVPSFSGSCPAFSMSFAIGGLANLGTHGFGNLCYALDFVKVCIMLGALFLCRAIVFGG